MVATSTPLIIGNALRMKERIVRYNPKLKARSRLLRNHIARGEVMLWQRLKPIDQFIVDFYGKASIG